MTRQRWHFVCHHETCPARGANGGAEGLITLGLAEQSAEPSIYCPSCGRLTDDVEDITGRKVAWYRGP